MPDTLTIHDFTDVFAELASHRESLPEKGDPLTLPSHISPEDWGVTVFSFVQHYRDGAMSYIIHPDLMDWLDGA